jgi:riboflavin biosynthesis pyrimidine reductase
LLVADSNTVTLRRLLPEPGIVSVNEAYSVAHRRRQVDRPWIIMCMIASADGALALDGRAEALGNATDRAVFLHLHRSTDSVLVGAATVRAGDVYTPLAAPRQLFIVSRSGDLGEHGSQLRASPTTNVVSGDVTDIVRQITGNTCLLEGGAVLNGQMLAAGLVDEVCLTYAPRFVSADSTRIAFGPPASRTPWRLAQLCVDDEGFLFARYERDTPSGSRDTSSGSRSAS